MGPKGNSRRGGHWREPSRNESRRRLPDDPFLSSPPPRKPFLFDDPIGSYRADDYFPRPLPPSASVKPSLLIEPIPYSSNWEIPAPPPPPVYCRIPLRRSFPKDIRVVLVFLMMILGNALLWTASRLAVAVLLPTDPYAYFAIPFLVCFGMSLLVFNHFSENRTQESGDAKLLAAAIAFFINFMLVFLLGLAEKSARLGL